jgi:glycosyltransferase involved in cell wall biosynthesis
MRGARALPGAVPDGVSARVRTRPVPARLLFEAWARLPFPPMELLAGRCDAVHGTNFTLAPSRAPGIVTVHDLTYLRHPQWVDAHVRRYRDLVPAALRRAAAVCTPSTTVRGELLEAYPWLDPGRVVATPLTVDASLLTAAPLDAAARANLGLPERYVLFLGASEPRKGLATLLAAYRTLAHDTGADAVPLVVAGPPGWGEQPEYADLPDGLVHRIGYVAPERLPGVLAGASALAFPSRYEGFGLPPLEALAAGVPAVVSDIPVLREVLGAHATYAPTDDPQAWAHALRAAASAHPDPEPGRRHAATFTPARLAETTLAAYRLAVSG